MAWRQLLLILTIAITFFVQRYWFSRAWRNAGTVGSGLARRVLRGMLVAAGALLVVAVMLPRSGLAFPRTTVTNYFLALCGLWLSLSFLALLAMKIVEAFEWTAARIASWTRTGRSRDFDQGRREFFRKAAYFFGSLPFAAGAYGFFKERLSYQIHRVEIPIPGLPRGLDGLRIAQLSDIHIGDFMPRDEVRRAVDMANDLGADLTVVTGDFVTGPYDPLEDCIAELSRLRAGLGVWGCNGNHEIYAGAEAAAQNLFSLYGMRLLRQQNAELSWNGEKFNLIGVDYQKERTSTGRKRPMLPGIESLVRKDGFNILLSHNPNSFPRAAQAGIQLSLAGHTHGGQVQVEIVDESISPARFMTKFIAGLYHLPPGSDPAASPSGQVPAGTSFLYVNRGLGTIGMPVRLGVPPEITLLTLRAV
jgi:predicted MPP superfamily phosphohydrolase